MYIYMKYPNRIFFMLNLSTLFLTLSHVCAYQSSVKTLKSSNNHRKLINLPNKSLFKINRHFFPEENSPKKNESDSQNRKLIGLVGKSNYIGQWTSSKPIQADYIISNEGRVLLLISEFNVTNITVSVMFHEGKNLNSKMIHFSHIWAVTPSYASFEFSQIVNIKKQKLLFSKIIVISNFRLRSKTNTTGHKFQSILMTLTTR